MVNNYHVITEQLLRCIHTTICKALSVISSPLFRDLWLRQRKVTAGGTGCKLPEWSGPLGKGESNALERPSKSSWWWLLLTIFGLANKYKISPERGHPEYKLIVEIFWSSLSQAFFTKVSLSLYPKMPPSLPSFLPSFLPSSFLPFYLPSFFSLLIDNFKLYSARFTN